MMKWWRMRLDGHRESMGETKFLEAFGGEHERREKVLYKNLT
jgi:hypothetical protein